MFWEITDFIRKVAGHWGALVTGGVVIGVVSVWQGTGHIVPPTVYWIIAIFALFFACFRAWREERRAKEKAEIALSEMPTLTQESWIKLYEERRRLEGELEAIEIPEPSAEVRNLPIDGALFPSELRLMTNQELYETTKRDRRLQRIRDELKLINDKLRSAPKNMLTH